MKKPQTFRTSKLEKFIEGMETRMNLIRQFSADDPEGLARATELEEVIGNLKHEFNLWPDQQQQENKA